MADPQDIREEQIKMTRLRVLVDLTVYRLGYADLQREDALSLIEQTRGLVLEMFPDKEDVFELVLRPRFRRILSERTRTLWGLSDAVN